MVVIILIVHFSEESVWIANASSFRLLNSGINDRTPNIFSVCLFYYTISAVPYKLSVNNSFQAVTTTSASHSDQLRYIMSIYMVYNKIHEFDIRGVLQIELVPTGQTVNQIYYLEVLKKLREKVGRKRPELFANNSWILHHDNAPAHTALSVREFLTTKQITVLEHPAYSPVLDPNDFFSIPEDKGNIEMKAF